MRRNDALLVCVLGLGAACTPRSVPVSIDLNKIPSSPVLIADASTVRAPGASVGGGGSVPGVPARNVFLGSGERQAKLAVEAAKKNQERAYRETLQALSAAYRAEATSTSDAEVAKLRAQYEAKFREGYDGLRKLFDAHADEVGPLWTRLSVLNGFPEKKGTKRQPPESDFLGRADFKEAAQIREKIAASDAAYRKEVSRRIEDLRQLFRADMTELTARRIQSLADADAKAESESKKMVTDIMKGLEQSLIQDVEKLHALPGAKVNIAPIRVPTVSVPGDNGPPQSDLERLQRRAGLFARLNGYRLVPAGKGVRDATQEFLTWDSHQGGR